MGEGSLRARAWLISLIVGTVAWLAHLVGLPSAGPRSLERPLADDAYYVLVAARNLAEGQGLTVDGEATNGFQPAFLALAYAVGAVARWDIHLTPALLARTMMLIHFVCGALSIGGLVARLAPAGPERVRFRLLASVLWCGGVVTTVAFFGLETPLSLCTWVWLIWAALHFRTTPTKVRGAAFGAVGGVAFLARNDAVFLIAAAGGLILVEQLACRRVAWPSFVVAAGTCLLLAMPWLVFNVSVTGSIVPQSGKAEAVGSFYDVGRLAQWKAIVVTVGRYLAVVPLPFDRLPSWLALATAASVVAVVTGAIAALRRHSCPDEFTFALRVSTGAAVLLAVTYGAAFGAPHMVLRWLAPWMIVAVLVVLRLCLALPPARRPLAMWLATAAIAVVAVVRGVQQHDSIRTNTYPLASYVEREFPHSRVGAAQSGLASWLRLNVVNLDGKVNREVLQAIRQGTFGAWLVASDVAVAVDWDFFGWERDPLVTSSFLVSRGPDGLIVLVRQAAKRSP